MFRLRFALSSFRLIESGYSNAMLKKIETSFVYGHAARI